MTQRYYKRNDPDVIVEKLIEDPRIRGGGALFVDIKDGDIYNRNPDGTDPHDSRFDFIPMPKKVWEVTYRLPENTTMYPSFTRYYFKTEHEALSFKNGASRYADVSLREITEDQMEK